MARLTHNVFSGDPQPVPLAMTSQFVEKAIRAMSDNHNVNNDTDYQRRAGGPCQLITTSESHWVAAFSDYIHRNVCADHLKATFNRFFEIPSLGSEAHQRAGYDLSVGPFDTNNRYRFMHKTALRWCDSNWVWETRSKNDRSHLAAILGRNHKPLARHKPFFVLHVFHCIHDWRRMGMHFADVDQGNEQYQIPDFPGLLRTVIIPLDPLKQSFDPGKWVRIKRIARAYSTGPIQDYLAAIEKPDLIECEIGGVTLTPITLDSLCNMMKEEWKQGGMWGNSSLL